MKTTTSISFLFFFFVCLNLTAQISGEKTIGGVSPDYAAISDATTALTTSGINGNVTFNIRDGVYNDRIVIGNVQGSSTFTITFQSQSMDSSKVKIDYVAGSSDIHLIDLSQAQNVTIQKMSFAFSGNYRCNMVKFSKGAKNIKFLNNSFKRDDQNAAIVLSPQTEDGQTAVSNIEFNSNYFESGYVAIRFLGGYWGKPQNIRVINNSFLNQRNNGICLESCENIKLNSNSINTLMPNTNDDDSAYGIGLVYCADYELQANRVVSSLGYGLKIENCTNTADSKRLVSNNFITTKIKSTGVSGMALNVNRSSFVDVVHNSFRLIGGDTGFSNSCVFVGGCSNFNFVNNLVYNNESASVTLENNTGIKSWNNNFLFGVGSRFAKFNDVYLGSFNDWKTTSNLDASSQSGQLTFPANYDLRLSNPLLDGKGIPWSTVTIDIDGKSRSLNNPDIGAYEFSFTTINSSYIDNSKLKIFPNPSSGNITVENEFLNSDMASLEIIDTNGKTIQLLNNISKNESVELNAGVYLVQLKVNNRLIAVKKVVVNK